MADLATVNNTLKEQNDLLEGNRARELENKREQDRKDAEMLKILSGIKPTVEINQSPADSGSLLKDILTGLGLIGTAGALGLAVGIAEGITTFWGNLIKRIGKALGFDKLIPTWIKELEFKRPTWVDDLLGKFKMPTWLDELKFTRPAWVSTLIEKFPKMAWLDELKFTRPAWVTTLIEKFPKMAWLDELKFTRPAWVATLIEKFPKMTWLDELTFTRPAWVSTLVEKFPKMAWLDELTFTRPAWIDESFSKVKSFFAGETSIFKTIGPLIDDAVQGVSGFTGGIFTTIKNFFTGETSVFKRIKTIIDPVVTGVSNFTGGIFTTIGNVFDSITDIGKSLAAPFKTLGEVLGFGGGAAGAVPTTGGKGVMAALDPFLDIAKKTFTALKNIGRTLAAPLNVIFGLFDAGFETADAVSKSEGFFATILNSIYGAIGGFIDGALFQLLDLLKSGISLLSGLFGFDEIEKTLDSFSFSEIWNGFLDDVYKFVNTMFNNPMELIQPVIDFFKDFFSIENLKKLVASALDPIGAVTDLFTDDRKPGEVRVTDFTSAIDPGADEINIEKLNESLKTMSEDQIKKLNSEFASYADTEGIENQEAVMDAIKAALKGRQRQAGGLIPSAGIYELHKGELVMDQLAVRGFERALQLVNMSQENALAGMAGGGTPVIINNTSVDNSSSVNSRQSVTVPQPVRSGESTKAAFDLAYGA